MSQPSKVRVCVTDQLPKIMRVRVRVLGVILSFRGWVAKVKKSGSPPDY
jgi:hypothetical protein